jgi:hypothetical protein
MGFCARDRLLFRALREPVSDKSDQPACAGCAQHPGLLNNLLVGSVGGSLLEACLLGANAATIWRLWRRS